MRLGIPASYAYYIYRPFFETFFRELGIEVEYSNKTNREIMERGASDCVDEACLPAKVCCGHAATLNERCDKLAVPRIMKTEYGRSVCPKVSGIPELMGRNIPTEKLIFTEPLYLNKMKGVKRILQKNCKKIGVSKKDFARAYEKALHSQKSALAKPDKTQYEYKILLLGHPYNINDSFINMNLLDKLHRMEIGTITADNVLHEEKEEAVRSMNLIKKPYWESFISSMGSAKVMTERGAVDGIIYLSSFSCGTDSFTVEMIRQHIKDIPMLVLKLDEQRGEAGYDTRLEAFGEVLKRR